MLIPLHADIIAFHFTSSHIILFYLFLYSMLLCCQLYKHEHYALAYTFMSGYHDRLNV